ncbi:hypothetical protein, partial [Sutterella sp.]|uniref:hypothetical protein n=1 Tax=Sutterella sp. TaxID=1981025 RepID=UPI0026DF2A12
RKAAEAGSGAVCSEDAAIRNELIRSAKCRPCPWMTPEMQRNRALNLEPWNPPPTGTVRTFRWRLPIPRGHEKWSEVWYALKVMEDRLDRFTWVARFARDEGLVIPAGMLLPAVFRRCGRVLAAAGIVRTAPSRADSPWLLPQQNTFGDPIEGLLVKRAFVKPVWSLSTGGVKNAEWPVAFGRGTVERIYERPDGSVLGTQSAPKSRRATAPGAGRKEKEAEKCR